MSRDGATRDGELIGADLALYGYQRGGGGDSALDGEAQALDLSFAEGPPPPDVTSGEGAPCVEQIDVTKTALCGDQNSACTGVADRDCDGLIDSLDPERNTCNTLRAAIDFVADPGWAFATWECGGVRLEAGGSFRWTFDPRPLSSDVYVTRFTYATAPEATGSEFYIQLYHYANQWYNDTRTCGVQADPGAPSLVRLRLRQKHDGSWAPEVYSTSSVALPAATYLLSTWAAVAADGAVTRRCALYDDSGSLLLEAERPASELPSDGFVIVGTSQAEVLVDYLRSFVYPMP